MDTLFPAHLEREYAEIQVMEEYPLFTTLELRAAVKSLGNRKAPGPDGIPLEVIKVIERNYPHLLLDMINACLTTGIFPRRWKLQRLVLLDKGKGPPITPASYRPLCMLDTMGKVYEKMLRGRLRIAISEAGGLSEKQHGFRPGHSTIAAIREVVTTAHTSWQGNHRTRDSCIVVTFDVKNAFNTASWAGILNALKNNFSVPPYLLRVINNYLWERELRFETIKGVKSSSITAGVAQGSALGPDLWNATYDGVLRLELPLWASIVGFADDIAAVIRARDPEEAQRRVTFVVRMVKDWMESNGFAIAPQKTEIVVLTRQRRFNDGFRVEIDGISVEAQTCIRYLGVMVDSKLTYWPHIRKAAERATKLVAALTGLMPNIAGARSSKRKALMSVTNSILLYGAEVWAEAFAIEKYRKRMATVQRKAALRITCAYRTVSEPATLVIAGVIPIDLMALERKSIYDQKEAGDAEDNHTQERQRSLLKWEQRWRETGTGRWTARLIEKVGPCVERKHGEVNFYITQFLTGHGSFEAYLYRCNKRNSPSCRHCQTEEDDVEHTFFACERWTFERQKLHQEIGVLLEPTNTVETMLESEEKWEAVAQWIERVLRAKKKEEAEQNRRQP